MWTGGLNPYDLYRDCDPNPDMNSIKMTSIARGLLPISRRLKLFKEPSYLSSYEKNYTKLIKVTFF